MPVSEEEVLRPVDPALTDSNEWEIFVLTDAHVAYESNGKLANLLAACADTPLKVVGRLEAPGRGKSKYLVKKQYKSTEIEIKHVTRFSYGEMTDGEFVIWAQGKAGWFEIRPTAAYKHIYEDMLQAVETLYFVTDLYNGPRKKGAGPSAQLVFQEYAEDERFLCNDATEAGEIFAKHHVFLMMCFLNRAQGIGWSNTPLYQYFRRQFPKDFDTCKARIEGRYAEVLIERQTRKSASTPSSTSNITSTAPKPRMGRGGKSTDQKLSEPPKKNDNWWKAAALFEFMQKAVNQRALRPGRNQITLERVSQLIVKRYEIEDLETAQNVVFVHSQNLCYMMNHPRRKSVRYFVDEPIYQELSAGHNLTAAEQQRAEGVELRPRKGHATLKTEETESSGEGEDALITPIRRPPGRRKKGRLSVLRPKSSEFSGKSKGTKRQSGKGKAPVRDIDSSSETSEQEDSEEETDSQDETGTDTPTQALSPGREKRKIGAADVDMEEERSRRKRTASEPPSLESPPTTAESEDNIDAETQHGEPSLPLRHRPSSSKPQTANSKSAVAPTLISSPLPTYEANASRDSWICSFDGCSQRIYGCSKAIGRQLITEHLEDHAKGTDKVVGILWREQDKLHLPVSNLIKKIREISDASIPLFPLPGAEQTMPRPIQRPL